MTVLELFAPKPVEPDLMKGSLAPANGVPLDLYRVYKKACDAVDGLPENSRRVIKEMFGFDGDLIRPVLKFPKDPEDGDPSSPVSRALRDLRNPSK